jgi:hypothetical protein
LPAFGWPARHPEPLVSWHDPPHRGNAPRAYLAIPALYRSSSMNGLRLLIGRAAATGAMPSEGDSMLSIAMAVSYAPAMYRDPSEWNSLHAWAVGAVPQPSEYGAETDEMRRAQAQRIEQAFAKLRQQLQARQIDAIVVLATDNGRLFNGGPVPQLCTFLGEELRGSTRIRELDMPADDETLRWQCAPELAHYLHEDLVWKGFDMSYRKLRSLTDPSSYGVSPSFLEPLRRLVRVRRVAVIS